MTDAQDKRLLIFDADGTLRRYTEPCPNAPGEWELLPNVKEKLASFPRRTLYAIVSNEGGVGLGHLTSDMAYVLLGDLLTAALGDYTERPICWIYACTHAPEDGCLCRKPSPYLLYRSMASARIKPRDTLYVGDMASDKEAAQRAGIAFQWACEFFGWETPCKGKAEELAREEAAYLCGQEGPQPGY